MRTIMPHWPLTALMVGWMAVVATAQQPNPSTTQKAGADDAKVFKSEELEQLVAPIALHPDSLLTQILMASTYPVEIVLADRWASENKQLKDDALTTALEKQDWDPSVKSLVNFPDVLTMMSKQLDWTTKLGDAFIADQAAVLAAIQRLRNRANAAGNLKDSAEQKVVVTQAPPQTVVVENAPPPPPQIITIESPNPSVVYVPAYNPTVVYGTWPYVAYPPPPAYYPPGYVANRALAFGAGVAVGAAWGYAWGHSNWGHGDVDIDVNRNFESNRNINRESYKQNMQNRNVNRTGANANSFQHDPAHRKGASYRDQATANKLGSPQAKSAAQARDSYRGRADGGAAGAGGGANRTGANRPAPAAAGGGARTGAGGGGAARPSPAAAPRQNSGNAFQGSSSGGSAARSASNRGAASRAPSSPPARSGGGGGGSRGGGGGGGGRGGGGRR